jgi:cytoskeletal protein RodZ
MKRCPQCSFLYLDTDEVCDLDGTPLIQVNDDEVEGSTAPISAAVPPKSETAGSRKGLILTAVGGLLVGVVIVFGYVGLARRRAPQVQPTQPVAQVAMPSPSQTLTPESATPTPEPSPSPSPSERSSPSPSPPRTRAAVNNNPVSTTANEKTTGPVVVRLTNGSRLEADEAWRTKEGVWYRRSGVVTLLSTSRVKSIERGGPK